MTTPRAEIAANVRAEAGRRRVTQADIARHLMLDRSSMAKRFNGQRDFTAVEIALISRFLDVSPAALLHCRTQAARAS